MTSKKFSEIVKEITEWQDKIFTEATPLSAAIHLEREVRELISDLANHGLDRSMRKEIADCFLLVVGVAHLAGVDLEAAIEEKMAINKAREWGKPDSQGVVEHVRGKTLLEVFVFDPESENLIKNIFEGESNGQVQAD